MFWDKKEESKLPDLPPLKPLPISNLMQKPGQIEEPEMQESDESEENVEKHSLPSFPDSAMQRGFSQSVIKDAINNEDTSESSDNNQEMISQMPPITKKFRIVEMQGNEDNSEQYVEEPMISEPPANIIQERARQFQQQSQNNNKMNDVFVKIEKFNAARRSLDNIKERVTQIDELLKRIRETKMREEQELSAWEKEIMSVKEKLQDVTQNIFEKLE